MVIYNKETCSYVVFLNSEELSKMNLIAESCSEKQVVSLLSKENIIESDKLKNARIEVHPGDDKLLIFIFLPPQDPILIMFNDYDNIVLAIKDLDINIKSSIILYNNYYILALWPCGCSYRAALEFGNEIKSSGNYYTHLLEHGRVIIDHYAIKKLNAYY